VGFNAFGYAVGQQLSKVVTGSAREWWVQRGRGMINDLQCVAFLPTRRRQDRHVGSGARIEVVNATASGSVLRVTVDDSRSGTPGSLASQ